MRRRLFIFLTLITGIFPLITRAQETAKAEAVIVYELADQHSQKQDANKVSPAIIPGVERQFYCMQNKTLYIEVAAGQARQCEDYLNSRGIICLLKKNCSLVQVEEQCSTLVKSEN